MRLWIPLLLAGCAGTVPTPAPTSEQALGQCQYVNSFSGSDECKEYVGDEWTIATAEEDCGTPMPGAEAGVFLPGESCSRDSYLGECFVDGDEAYTLVFPGLPGDSCDGLTIGCGFAGGEFVPSQLCDDGGSGPSGSSVFQPFEQVCVAPLASEPPGNGPNGDVCTWEAISGATEAGRKYTDYAECAPVLTQRPYYYIPVENTTSPNDPRLSDEAWVEEYEWATEQFEATACVCCHTEQEAPNGEPSGWYLEAGPIWTDTMDDEAMAMIAGWVDSTAFGAFDAEDNNGFSRDKTGVPTTDSARMISFFEGELSRRGRTRADFASTAPFGGPLYDQLQYEPSLCSGDEGVNNDGSVTWSGGDARYIYVLEPQASAPGVPPNLDIPNGTIWRLDVGWQSPPVSPGLTYGQNVAGASQGWPLEGRAPALVSGSTYYLYVLADIYVPLTRCLFVAP